MNLSFNSIDIPFNKINNFIEFFNENNQYNLNLSNQDYLIFNNNKFNLIHTTYNYNINNNEYKMIGDLYDDEVKYIIGKKDDKLYLYYGKFLLNLI